MCDNVVAITVYWPGSLCGAPAAGPYKYLVLKGGGIRGIAYTGAIRALEKQHITDSLEKVGGTSIGAVVAMMLCAGVKADEMELTMEELDVSMFNDGEWFFIGGGRRMRRNYGWYKGNAMEQWLADILEQKTGKRDITFAELHELSLHNRHYRDLYVTATNLSRQRTEILSWETHPAMQVKAAVRASVSIPLYFGAVFMDSAGNVYRNPPDGLCCDVYADGGLAANYPLTMFNTRADDSMHTVNRYTLGLKLERPEQIGYRESAGGIAPYPIHSLTGYVGALYNFVIEGMNPAVPYAIEKQHTIYISTSNISPRVRKVSRQQKQLLYENGYKAAAAFLNID